MLLGSSLTAITFFSSLSSANTNFGQPLFLNQAKVTVLMFALPHSKGEGITAVEHRIANNKMNSLTPLPLPKSNRLHSCKKKQSSLYELSAIFNDKLQMFLAYLNKPSKTQIAKQNTKKEPLGAPNSQIKL